MSGVRRWLALVSVLLAMMAAAAEQAKAQTTTVQDTVYLADGSTAAGTVLVNWGGFTTASGEVIAAGNTSTTLGAGGVLTISLVANAGATPTGSYYTAIFHLSDGTTSRQYWVLPVEAAGAAPVKLAAIENQVLPTSVAMQTVSKAYVDNAIAAAQTGLPVGTAAYVSKAGDTMAGPLVLPGDPVSPNQAADKNYVDNDVAAIAGGLSSKVSTLPAATQVMGQPAGTQLEVNHLNGALYASQYLTGLGNNGIGNAAASPDCAKGCNLVIDSNDPLSDSLGVIGPDSQLEGYSLPSGTGALDYRGGGNFYTGMNAKPAGSLNIFNSEGPNLGLSGAYALGNNWMTYDNENGWDYEGGAYQQSGSYTVTQNQITCNGSMSGTRTCLNLEATYPGTDDSNVFSLYSNVLSGDVIGPGEGARTFQINTQEIPSVGGTVVSGGAGATTVIFVPSNPSLIGDGQPFLDKSAALGPTNGSTTTIGPAGVTVTTAAGYTSSSFIGTIVGPVTPTINHGNDVAGQPMQSVPMDIALTSQRGVPTVGGLLGLNGTCCFIENATITAVAPVGGNPWNSTANYRAGQIVSLGGELYTATAASNNQNPPGSPQAWTQIGASAGVYVVTANVRYPHEVGSQSCEGGLVGYGMEIDAQTQVVPGSGTHRYMQWVTCSLSPTQHNIMAVQNGNMVSFGQQLVGAGTPVTFYPMAEIVGVGYLGTQANQNTEVFLGANPGTWPVNGAVEQAAHAFGKYDLFKFEANLYNPNAEYNLFQVGVPAANNGSGTTVFQIGTSPTAAGGATDFANTSSLGTFAYLAYAPHGCLFCISGIESGAATTSTIFYFGGGGQPQLSYGWSNNLLNFGGPVSFAGSVNFAGSVSFAGPVSLPGGITATSGTLDGVKIGATAPAAGAFTSGAFTSNAVAGSGAVVTINDTTTGTGAPLIMNCPNSTATNPCLFGVGQSFSAGNMGFVAWEPGSPGFLQMQTYNYGSPVQIGASAVNMTSSLMVNNGAGLNALGPLCGTGIAFCVNPSSTMTVDSSGDVTAAAYVGPATAPTGSCSKSGAWVFSQDGHATFCSAGTWVTKL
jgi:hypothetical protein